MKKRILSIFLAVCLILTLLPVGALAEGNSVETEPTLAVSGTNSVGKLISKEVSQETDETTGGNKISDLTVDGNTAAVQFTTDTNECDIVVAIYDENNGTHMLASGTVTVYSGDSEVSIELSGDIPESFVATAYMLERESHSPLCTAYTTKMYTSEMQAFLATTVNDYDEKLVFNLDDSEETNFAVFNEDTLRADESSGMSIEDKGNGIYIVTNADADVKALSEGDEFAYTYDDGTVLLVAVASITIDGDTVTITEAADADLQDFFDYVKIEGTNDENTETTIDTSDMDDCVTLVDEATPRRARARSVDTEGSFGSSISAKIDNDSIEGSVTFSYKVSLKVYINNGYKSVSLTNNVKLELSVALEPVKGELGIKLCSINIPMVPGVKVQIAPSIVAQISVKLQWKASIEATIGFGYDSDIGFVNKCSGPKCDSKVELSGKLFIGLKVSASVDIISDKIASLGLESKAGAEVSAKERLDNDSTGSKKHECERCITGEINGVDSLTAKANFIKFKTEKTFSELKIKIADFYTSITFGDSGWGTCPHISYKVTVKALDKEGNPLPNATVTCSALTDTLTTDNEGKVSFFAPNGEYTLNIESNDLKADRKFTVHSSKKEMSVRLTPPPKVVASGKCGDDITWQLDEAGTLTISGTGEMYNYNGNLSNYAPWNDKRQDVKKVVVKGDVTNIGDWAFWGCGNLASVSLPDSATRIGSYAFCSGLSQIVLPKNLTTIESRAFEGCSNLKKIILPDSVTSIGKHAFSNCSSLETVVLSDSLISIGDYAFYGDFLLSNIEIPRNVAQIGNLAFAYCNKLKSIPVEEGNIHFCSKNGILYNKDMTKIVCYPAGKTDISQFDIPDGIAEIGVSAFANCMALRTIEIPSSVTTIGATAFVNCRNLYSVNIPQSVTSIGSSAFNSCYNISSLVIPEGVESIEYSTFRECHNLAEIWLPSSLKKVGKTAFSWCNSLKDVYYSGSEAQWNEIEFDEEADLPNATIHYNSPYIDWTSPSNLKVYDNTNPAVTTGLENSAPVKAVAAQSADSGSQVKTSSFGDLQSGVQYVFVAVRNPDAEEYFAYDNLCYIDQNAADTYGSLSFSYYSDADTVSENLYVMHAHAYVDGVCTICGIADPTYEPPHEHSFGEWTVTTQPTCTEKGMETRTCTRCNASETRDITSLGHAIVRHAAKAATCTEKGWAAYDTCSRCDYSTYKEIAATGHHHNAVVTAPTCTAKGYTTHTCACGDSYKDSYTNALGHSYANGKCTRCGAADHNYKPAPKAPALKITTVSGKPKISWNAVDGAVKYWVYRSTDGKNFKYYDRTNNTSYTNKSTEIGTTYYYKVKAVNANNAASDYSVSKGIRCKPAAPTVSIYRTNGKPKLSWKAVSGAKKYWIYRSTDGKNFKYFDSTTKTSYTNSGAASGTKYYYRVKAVAVVNGKNVTSANSSTKSLMTTLAKPSVSITTSNGKPKVTWKAVTGADKYYIYRSTDGKTFSYWDSTTKTSYINSGAKKNTKYYYKVKAVCASNSNANSAQSSAVSIKAAK